MFEFTSICNEEHNNSRGEKTKVSLEAFLSGTGFIEEFPTDLKIHVDQNFRGKKRSKEPGEKRRLGHKWFSTTSSLAPLLPLSSQCEKRDDDLYLLIMMFMMIDDDVDY